MIYIFLTEGFETIEALTSVDVLRRCKLDVVTVGVGAKRLKSAQGIYVEADITDSELKLNDNIQMIVLPGGPGTKNYETSDNVKKALEFCSKKNIYISAICAAPSVPGKMNLLAGKKATCFPGYESQLYGAKVCGDKVCKDGFYITAKGAGVSLDFALKIAEVLCGKETSNRIAESMQCK